RLTDAGSRRRRSRQSRSPGGGIDQDGHVVEPGQLRYDARTEARPPYRTPRVPEPIGGPGSGTTEGCPGRRLAGIMA
ncbi:hypothetical protein AB0F43_02815, partial [Kribbella sp. NPDC023972]|uniref:hypothetical protein n=1 Tax=Kribbella sp. NPDC023972 TaxID=3154795 RepID=UPI0033D79781